jgi:hypothetical protein
MKPRLCSTVTFHCAWNTFPGCTQVFQFTVLCKMSGVYYPKCSINLEGAVFVSVWHKELMLARNVYFKILVTLLDLSTYV